MIIIVFGVSVYSVVETVPSEASEGASGVAIVIQVAKKRKARWHSKPSVTRSYTFTYRPDDKTSQACFFFGTSGYMVPRPLSHLPDLHHLPKNEDHPGLHTLKNYLRIPRSRNANSQAAEIIDPRSLPIICPGSVNASASKPGIGGAQIAFRLALEMRLIS